MRVVENSLLTRIIWPERDEIIWDCRKLHTRKLLSRVIKSRKMKMAEHVPHMEERCIKILVEKHGGKRPIRRSRRRWEENNKMDLQEVEWGELTGLIWFRWRDVAKVIMNFQVP